MRFIEKSICGATLVLAAGSAAAQSSVTLYGVVDAFMQYEDNGGTHTFSERSGGSTSSLFGLKGSEDLGGGTKAEFDVETGFNANNGVLFADTTALFYRQAWVGLSNQKYGSVSMGRQYQPSFIVVYPTDPFHANEILSPLSAMVLATFDRNTLATQYDPGRISNSILYKSPDLYGFKFYGMYGFAATTTQPVPETSGNVLDVGATYSGYGLYAGAAYTMQHPGTETLPTLPSVLNPLNLMATEHFTGALAYRIGIVNLQFNYSYSRPDTPAARSTAALLGAAHPVSNMELGATIQATPQDAIVIAGIERNVRGAHDNTPGVEVGVDHNISKRTSFYARAGYIKNNGTSMMSWPGIQPTATDSKQYLAVLGITHRF